MRKYFYLVLVLFLLVWIVGCDDTGIGIPLITSVNPASGIRGETLDVTITGANFIDATNVYFGPDVAIQVNSFEVVSATEILANIYIYLTATLGPKDVSVTTTYDQADGEKLFTVVGLPSITSVSPATGVAGAAIDVTIQGEGFYGVTGVKFGSGFPDIDTDAYQVYSEYAPVTILATINIDAESISGARDVTVYTNHGTATGSGLFTVTAGTPAPVVSSVTPNGWIIDSTITVTIKGINFSETPEPPIVSFGPDIIVNSVTLINPGEIQANITIPPEAVLGYHDVSVTIGSETGVGIDLFDVYTLI